MAKGAEKLVGPCRNHCSVAVEYESTGRCHITSQKHGCAVDTSVES
jgi:carbamoylphosphate synthase small subunit